MKKLFTKLKNKATAVAITAKTYIEDKKAEGYVDSGVKVLIIIVIGALLLGGLYMLFDDNIMPKVTDRVNELFNYTGE